MYLRLAFESLVPCFSRHKSASLNKIVFFDFCPANIQYDPLILVPRNKLCKRSPTAIMVKRANVSYLVYKNHLCLYQTGVTVQPPACPTKWAR